MNSRIRTSIASRIPRLGSRGFILQLVLVIVVLVLGEFWLWA
jgi:hypothetical protein